MTNKPEPNTRAGEAQADAHATHCGIGEYANTCKYGDDDCPAMLTRPLPQPSELVEPFKRIGRAMANPYDGGIWEGRYFNKSPFVTVRLSDLEAVLASAAQIAKLQADGDKLAGYVEHDSDCHSNVWSGGADLNPCTCGLTQALTEWKDRA